MRKAVREILDSSDRREECPGPDHCPRVQKAGHCMAPHCPASPDDVDPFYLSRFHRACETLLLIEHLGLRFNDLDWPEIPDLKILITERNAYYSRKNSEMKDHARQR